MRGARTSGCRAKVRVIRREAGPPTVPADGVAPHQQLRVKRGQQQETYAAAGGGEERLQGEDEDPEPGVEHEQSEERHPTGRRNGPIGEVSEQIHSRRMNVRGVGGVDNLGDGTC